MSQPDWKDAPEWAQWLAMDEDGQWCWFVGEPSKYNYVWMPAPEYNNNGDTYEEAFGFSGSQTTWEETLEPRP